MRITQSRNYVAGQPSPSLELKSELNEARDRPENHGRQASTSLEEWVRAYESEDTSDWRIPVLRLLVSNDYQISRSALLEITRAQ
jgi:hypothetical protein